MAGCSVSCTPRTLDFAEFPAIDAVVISHEHDDHFDIPSINRLDRSIPIYLSSRSSIAAHQFLRELGFRVGALEPEAELGIGDLRYRSFACDHRDGSQGDEWDVFPMWVGDVGGHGSLLSSVDVSAPVPALERPPSVWAHAHNSTRTEFQRIGPGAATSTDAALLLAVVLRRFATLEAVHGAPAAALISGQGWSFPGERAWINHEAFPVGARQLADAITAASPQTQAFAPAPGFTLELVDGRLVGVRDSQPYCATTRPRERWPDRSYAPTRTVDAAYGPACGRTGCGTAELEQLLAQLDDFARYLYGTAVFRSLCSLPSRVDGIPAAIGFSLRVDDGDARVVLRYEPSACRFVRVEPGVVVPERTLLSGIECFASDLLAFLRGEISPSALCYAGRVRTWNHAATRLWFSPHELWMFGHPLRRPDRAARLYRSLLTAEPANPGQIRGRISG